MHHEVPNFVEAPEYVKTSTMKSVQTLRVAFARARSYSLSHSKTSLPLLSQKASEYSTDSPICPIHHQLPIPINLCSRQRTKDTPKNRRCLSTTRKEDDSLQRTALYDLHVQNKATMVPFGGYSMPVRYADLTISESHHWTRNKASLFDVGHMYGATFTFVTFGAKRLNPTELGSSINSQDLGQSISSKR